MHKKVKEHAVTGEGGGALVEAALILSLLTMIMFGGWKIIQTVTLRAQLFNILSTVGQIVGRDPDTNYTEIVCGPSDRNNFCAVARNLFENTNLPSCALSVRITKFPIEDLLSGNTRSFYEGEVALNPLTKNASDIFPDWYANEVEPGASRYTGIRRQLGKVDITYDYKKCGERKPDLQVTTTVSMIFPVYNANEVGP